MQDPTSFPATVGETAYERIRLDIIFGRLQPGARLKLDQIKTVYNVSVSTLREILYRLCAESLVLAEGQRGFTVAPVSQKNFREVAGMREFLETHALEESFRRGDVEWEAGVVAAHHRLSRLETQMLSGNRSEPEVWKRYDWEFHRALIAACGSTALLATHARIFDQYLRYQIIAVIFRGEQAANEHRELLQLALSRDHVKAGQILKRHIHACVEHTVENGLLPK
ncbi:GntR family transcriptional regulator [Mesorhizobium sp. SB112]|uniref:GntR family transcriptional regulator n=2 Tax=Pseudomonadota TaxID=1224 RepID=UPI003267D62C